MTSQPQPAPTAPSPGAHSKDDKQGGGGRTLTLRRASSSSDRLFLAGEEGGFESQHWPGSAGSLDRAPSPKGRRGRLLRLGDARTTHLCPALSLLVLLALRLCVPLSSPSRSDVLRLPGWDDGTAAAVLCAGTTPPDADEAEAERAWPLSDDGRWDGGGMRGKGGWVRSLRVV